jgi:hypothetical protein
VQLWGLFLCGKSQVGATKELVDGPAVPFCCLGYAGWRIAKQEEVYHFALGVGQE